MSENDSVHYAQIGKTPNSKFPTNNSQHLSHQLLSKHHTHTHTHIHIHTCSDYYGKTSHIKWAICLIFKM